MNSKYKISVIVPIYNSAEYLHKCIDSIVDQMAGRIEIVLVDDGSYDGSEKICDEYAERYECVRVIHKENGGLISARIAGVLASEAELISFIDSDDYVEPHMFEAMYETYKNMSCDLICTGIIRNYSENGKTVIVHDNYAEGLYSKLNQEIYPTMLYDFEKDDFGIYCNLVTKLFKKNLLMKVLKNIDTEIFYGEDAAILYPYCLLCGKIYIMHEAFYHYCIRNYSMCWTPNSDMTINTYRLFVSLKSAFADHECSNVLMKQLKRYILGVEVHTLQVLYDINPTVFIRWEFDYSENVFRDKFIIYGAGAFGQALFHFIRRKGFEENMVTWIDRNAGEVKKECDYNIEYIDEGIKKEHKYVIIAVNNEKVANEIKEELVNVYREEEYNIIWNKARQSSFFSEALY